jgi:hypothetical protein
MDYSFSRMDSLMMLWLRQKVLSLLSLLRMLSINTEHTEHN